MAQKHERCRKSSRRLGLLVACFLFISEHVLKLQFPGIQNVDLRLELRQNKHFEQPCPLFKKTHIFSEIKSSSQNIKAKP